MSSIAGERAQETPGATDSAGVRPLPQLEQWPLSEHTTQRQIDEWSFDQEHVELYSADEETRRAFLEFKRDNLSWERSEYYFRKLGIPIKGKILEQGAGCFWLSSFLSQFDAVDEVVGVELSETCIEAFRSLALSLFPAANSQKIRYVIGDMHRLHVPDDTFDLIVCSATLHHADNLVAMLRESWRKLKPGGWFVALREPVIPAFRLRDPVFNSRFPEDGSAQYYYKEGWKGAFLNAWFVNIRTTPFVEYGFVRGRRVPWLARRLLRTVDPRQLTILYPKICIAGQKPR